MSSVSVVVLVSKAGPGLVATLDALAQQTVSARDVTVVFPATDIDPPPLLRAVAARPGVTIAPSVATEPGAMRNAAVHRSNSELLCWLDEGDIPARTLIEMSANGLHQKTIDFIAPIASIGHVDESPTLVVPAVDLAELLCASDRVPIGGVLRRSAWDAVGGFDETLPAFDEYDLWIRILQRGCTGTLLRRRLVVRPISADSWVRRNLRSETVDRAVAMIAIRHQTVFEPHTAEMLISRDRDLSSLRNRHATLIAQRNRLVGELESNEREIETLRASLLERGRDRIEWGDLRHAWPVSHDWGYDRGTPVDRVYIEQFIGEWTRDIRGHVLEVQEPELTRRFGGDRVERVDVIDINTDNAGATIVGDLRGAPHVPSDAFDCFVLTQTLHVIDDMPAVLREAYRILKPGGVLLATLPCASRVCLEYGPDGDFWRVTEAGARTLFERVFDRDQVQTRAYGNVLSNVAFLLGLASHEVSSEELASFDPYFPLLIGVRAVKPAHGAVVTQTNVQTASDGRSLVLLYHRVAEPDSDVHDLAVSPRLFRQQMEYLKATRLVIPLDELVDAAEQGTLPNGAVALTFDDGYRDNLECAAAILVELGLPATFFLTTQAFDGRPEYWWDALERALLGENVPDSLDMMVSGQPLRLRTSTPAERSIAHGRLHELLVPATLEVRDAHVAEILLWSGVPVKSSLAPILTAHEVQQLARLPGCSIGTHTVHHLALGFQTAPIVARELQDSRRALASLVGREISAVAYPYGDYKDETVAAVRAEGFEVALTCDGRPIGATDRFAVPRVEVKAWPVAELDRRLAFAREGRAPV